MIRCVARVRIFEATASSVEDQRRRLKERERERERDGFVIIQPGKVGSWKAMKFREELGNRQRTSFSSTDSLCRKGRIAFEAWLNEVDASFEVDRVFLASNLTTRLATNSIQKQTSSPSR